VHAQDEKGLCALAEDLKLQRRIIVCHERQRRVTESGIEILPVEEFFGRTLGGRIFLSLSALVVYITYSIF